MTQAVFERLRKICLALPETVETSAFGHPKFKAGKKTFVTFENFEGSDSFAFRVDPLQFDALLLDRKFFPAPYGRGQWISLPVEASLDWSLAKEKVLSSYRYRLGNKRMLAAMTS